MGVDEVTFGLGVSADSTVIFGYGARSVTLTELATKLTWSAGAWEFKRRNLAMFLSHPRTGAAGVDAGGLPILHSAMGCGSAGRDPVQQRAEFLRRHSTTPTGRKSRMFEGRRYHLKKGMAPYAPPGSSVHEAGIYDGGCLASDNVGWEDGWQVANAERFGLKTFDDVNDEPWHVQPAEYSNSRRKLDDEIAAGRRMITWELPPLPGVAVTPPPAAPVAEPVAEPVTEPPAAPVAEPATAPAATDASAPLTAPVELPPLDFEKGLFGLFPLAPKVLLKKGDEHSGRNDEMVKYAQAVLKKLGLYAKKIDGIFGEHTKKAVIAFQRKHGLDPDGRIGTGETWPALDLAAVGLL